MSHHHHDHPHPHPHSHPHPHPGAVGVAVAVAERPGQWRPHTPPGETPVLDIGGDVGALVVYLPELTASGELDVQPVGRPEGRFHTGVHDRPSGAGGGARTWVAIFPEMTEGSYELLDDHGALLAQVAVAGGEVRELDLR